MYKLLKKMELLAYRNYCLPVESTGYDYDISQSTDFKELISNYAYPHAGR